MGVDQGRGHVEPVGNDGVAPRRDDDRGGIDRDLADDDGRPAGQARLALQPVSVGDGVIVVEHRPYEAVALGTQFAEHARTVDLDRADMDAPACRSTSVMREPSRRDQQLGRHAADTGAGRSARSLLDEEDVGTAGDGSLVGLQPRRTSADHQHVATHPLHRPLPWGCDVLAGEGVAMFRRSPLSDQGMAWEHESLRLELF